MKTKVVQRPKDQHKHVTDTVTVTNTDTVTDTNKDT